MLSAGISEGIDKWHDGFTLFSYMDPELLAVHFTKQPGSPTSGRMTYSFSNNKVVPLHVTKAYGGSSGIRLEPTHSLT